MGLGLLIFLFLGLVAVFGLFISITFLENTIFKRKYEEKNPTKKDGAQVVEDEISNQSVKFYKLIVKWFNKKLKRGKTE